MRFLLSLILLSFFFLAPFQGNAGKVSGKALTTNIEGNTPWNQLIDYSMSDGHDMAITHSAHGNSTTNQRRFYSFPDFLNTIAFKSSAAFFYEIKPVPAPHVYCKRIGLKLVFPEHYFW